MTRENYPTVETSRQFAIQIKNAGGINNLNKFDGIAKVDNQPIIRLNQDTVYSMVLWMLLKVRRSLFLMRATVL